MTFVLMGLALLALSAWSARRYTTRLRSGGVEAYRGPVGGRRDPRLELFAVVVWGLLGVLLISVPLWA